MDEEDDLDFSPEDPSWFLERLDESLDPEAGGPADTSPSDPPLSRGEIEDLVNRVLNEELARTKKERE
jgi:hypothetical protein